jgi:hypothetical protein
MKPMELTVFVTEPFPNIPTIRAHILTGVCSFLVSEHDVKAI